MKRGDQQRIADFTGISKGVISKYFSGKQSTSIKNINLIQKAVKELEIEMDVFPQKKSNKRLDIINNLAENDQIIISLITKVSAPYVSAVLAGKINQNTKLSKKIIREAELMAAINIWKTRFCKFDSEL